MAAKISKMMAKKTRYRTVRVARVAEGDDVDVAPGWRIHTMTFDRYGEPYKILLEQTTEGAADNG